MLRTMLCVWVIAWFVCTMQDERVAGPFQDSRRCWGVAKIMERELQRTLVCRQLWP